MSDTAHPGGDADIGKWLKSAAEIDPSRLPRLVSIAEALAEDARLGFDRLSLTKLWISSGPITIVEGPDGEEDEENGDLFAALLSKRFAKPAFLSAPRALADVLITSFFGASASAAGVSRGLTELDRALVDAALKQCVESLKSAFAVIDAAGFELGGFMDESARAEAFGGENRERFAEIQLELREAPAKASARFVEESDPLAVIRLALPLSYLALHRRRLCEPEPVPEPSPDETWSEAMIESFEKSGLHLEAVLARRRIPLGEVARFRVGQTIALGVGVGEPITLECEGKPIFRSQIGFARGSYVARFEETVDPAREFIDDILGD